MKVVLFFVCSNEFFLELIVFPETLELFLYETFLAVKFETFFGGFFCGLSISLTKIVPDFAEFPLNDFLA